MFPKKIFIKQLASYGSAIFFWPLLFYASVLPLLFLTPKLHFILILNCIMTLILIRSNIQCIKQFAIAYLLISFNSFVLSYGIILNISFYILYSLIGIIAYFFYYRDYVYNDYKRQGTFLIIPIILIILCCGTIITLYNIIDIMAYIIIVFFISYTAKKIHAHLQETQSLISNIIHDTRNAITLAYSSIDELTCVITDSADKQKSGRYNIRITEADYSLIEFMQQDVKVELNRGIFHCGNIIAMMSGKIEEGSARSHKMSDIINVALKVNLWTAKDQTRFSITVHEDFNLCVSKYPLRTYIQIILLNLIKFYKDSNIQIIITKDTLIIHNNQCNFDQNEAKHIFDPLYQTKNYFWDKVGMYTCYQIAQHLNYDLICEAHYKQSLSFILKVKDLAV